MPPARSRRPHLLARAACPRCGRACPRLVRGPLGGAHRRPPHARSAPSSPPHVRMHAPEFTARPVPELTARPVPELTARPVPTLLAPGLTRRPLPSSAGARAQARRPASDRSELAGACPAPSYSCPVHGEPPCPCARTRRQEPRSTGSSRSPPAHPNLHSR
nr:uncharacterized protein LOC127328459 [Lolium perenne]